MPVKMDVLTSVSCVLCSLTFLLHVLGGSSLEDDCRISNNTLTCQFSIPQRLPKDTKEVFIQKYKEVTISNQSFDHISWEYLYKLDIVAIDELHILSHNFNALKNLSHLGIHSTDIELDKFAFNGLQNLFHLDLSMCINFNTDTLIPALMANGALPNLKSLNLNYLNSKHGRLVQLNEEVWQMLSVKAIETISLSGTNLLLINNYKTDISGFKFQLKHVDVSNITLADGRSSRSALLFQLLRTMETLDFSYTLFDRFSPLKNLSNLIEQINCTLEDSFVVQLTALQKLYANEILTFDIKVNNSTIDFSHCNVNFSLEVLHLRGNNLRHLNITLLVPQNNSVKEMDLSSNKMSYLSPNVLRDLTSLEVLVLSDNDLFQMEHLAEFEYLLFTLLKLRHFDFSSNRLSYLPNKMFTNNPLVQTLDLSSNRLKTISLRMEHLTELNILRIQNNSILFLEGASLSEISNVFQNGIKNKCPLDLGFQGNPFECSCDSLQFVKWLVYEYQPVSGEQLTCNLEGHMADINQSAIDSSKYLCERTKIIIVVSLLSITLIVIAVVIFKCIHRIRQRRNFQIMVKDFIQKFKMDELQENILVFLSYNADSYDEEEDEVISTVLEKMIFELKKIVGRDKNVLRADDVNVRLGCYRDTEANKCMADICVVVLLVSAKSPENRFFKTDLELAKYNKKPICILSQMNAPQSKFISMCYKMYPTVELQRHNGIHEPRLGWAHFCQQLLIMAAKEQH